MLRQALSASLATPSALLACCCSQLSTQQLWLRSGYGQSLPGADAVSTSSSAPQAAPQFPSSRQFSSSSHPGDAAGSSKSEKAEEGSQPATTSAASAPSQPSLETLASALHRSNRSRQHGPAGSPAGKAPPFQADLFTQSMQKKTEQQLQRIIEEMRAAKLASAATSASVAPQQGATASSQEAEPEDDDDGPDKPTNPATGEYGGPKGKEPTRYGDWAFGGRVTDF